MGASSACSASRLCGAYETAVVSPPAGCVVRSAFQPSWNRLVSNFPAGHHQRSVRPPIRIGLDARRRARESPGFAGPSKIPHATSFPMAGNGSCIDCESVVAIQSGIRKCAASASRLQRSRPDACGRGCLCSCMAWCALPGAAPRDRQTALHVDHVVRGFIGYSCEVSCLRTRDLDLETPSAPTSGKAAPHAAM